MQQTSLERIETNQNVTQVFSGNNKIIAKLLISADGKNSFVREIIGTPAFKKKYNHSAFVTNFSHKKNHNNIAHEIFLESGPLALLPIITNTSPELTENVTPLNTLLLLP